MKFPKPSAKKYIEIIATVLVIMAIFQYTGIFFENSGEIDLEYLIGVGLVLPITTYLLTVVTENIEWIPNWEKMNQSEQ